MGTEWMLHKLFWRKTTLSSGDLFGICYLVLRWCAEVTQRLMTEPVLQRIATRVHVHILSILSGEGVGGVDGDAWEMN